MAALHRSSVQDQIADVTECSICTEIFTNPKVLPCVHTFCLHCLEKYGNGKKPGDQMVCPICRKEFHIPVGGFSHLPNNFFIGKMVEIGKLTMTLKNKELCALCPEDDEVLAQLFCVDCEQNLCSRCGSGHKKSRFSQHHQIVELGSQLNSSEINLRNSYCDHHPGEQIKMFCYEDNVAICLVCCVESHQSHRCVNVNKAAGEFMEQLKDRVGKVTNRLSECVEFEVTLDKFKTEFQAEVMKTEEGIRDAANKMTKLIEEHTELLIQDLKLVAERNLKAFEITKQDIDRFRVMIDSYSSYSERLLCQGSPVDICRATNQMLTRAQELETQGLSASSSGDCFCCDTMVFHPSHIELLMKPFGLSNAVGQLTVTRSSDWLLKFGRETTATDDFIAKESVVCQGKGLSSTRHLEEELKSKHILKETMVKSASSNCTIFIWQIPHKLNKDYLAMIFENKRIGGGKIEDVDYDQEEGTAVITFEDPNVAASFLKKEILEFKGHRMLITKHEDQGVYAERGKDSGDIASAKQLPSAKYDASGSFNTVKVSGIPQNVSKDVISMYFENKKLSGGGSFKLLENQMEKGKVVMKFDNPGDGVQVCKRHHVLSGVTLKISVLEMPLEDVKSCAIEVKGLGERATADFLELHFENTRRSGGGPVEKVFLNKEARTAIVVFQEATAVVGVMNKRPHKLDGASLEVTVLEAAPPSPLLLSDVDTDRLLAKRLPPSTTRESLREYLSSAAKAKMVGWTLAVKPSTALLEFSSEPDYLSIRRLVGSKPFLGRMISIRRVPLTSSILVTGMPPFTSAEFVAMNFENPRNGGTGEDCKAKMLPGNVSAIVEFQRPDVIRTITSRQHYFDKKEVKVEPYYPWLGLSSPSRSSITEIPTSVTHTFYPKAVHFILKRQDLKKYIENSLEKWNCCIVWPSEGKGEVKLEYKRKEKQKPTAGWDVECKKVLQRYADELTWKQENVLQEIWNDFKKKIQEYATNKSKLLDIAFENDRCEIQYIGLKRDTDEFEKVIKKMKMELELELERWMISARDIGVIKLK